MFTSNSISHSTAPSSSLFSPSNPPSNFLIGQSLTICSIVWSGAPQSHSVESAKFHRNKQCEQFPCPVLMRFRRTHAFLGRLKPSCLTFGLVTSSLWYTFLFLQIDFHSSPGRNGMSLSTTDVLKLAVDLAGRLGQCGLVGIRRFAVFPIL